ncbi:PREDICTED: signal-transducing adaptor protein 1 [Calidris pugnax]|uniref:signal-transducing adaptor protein 1 n=1 Tax=Calidris pugnax TaxID=198806 RepID=UPI00071D0175|nr:PREDICTED: signal-transducing adaptor protein 1 [Calidris pugnax]
MLRGGREQPEGTPQPAPRHIFQERQRITSLPLYFQGYLSVRHSRCQEFRMYWTELRGTMLFFYDDKKAPTYSQKLDISALTSATNVCPDESGSARFILMLPTGELELKANDCECGKEWKGFILTVTELSIPPDESLPPEQLRRMQEVLYKEKHRRNMLNNCASTALDRKSPPSSTQTPLPACFYAVSRQEAVEMLEKNPAHGNLILRPGSDSKNYAITVLHRLDPPHLKHYKVVSKGTSYLIDLERQVTLPSLQDVVSYFMTQTRGTLKPYVVPTRAAEDPVCFYAVSRQEAVEMLEKNPSHGNLILRPGSDSKNYAITVLHRLDPPHLKHYKVVSKGTSYLIDLERQDVVSYFMTQTRGTLKPYVVPTRAAEDPVS